MQEQVMFQQVLVNWLANAGLLGWWWPVDEGLVVTHKLVKWLGVRSNLMGEQCYCILVACQGIVMHTFLFDSISVELIAAYVEIVMKYG